MTSLTQSTKIKILPEHLIDQIQAGEVVEKPASLLKELLENSVDAGATKITIHLKQNGLELITIRDNGSGINFNDLPFAFCRHATSKISSFEDLFKIRSYGFRGEALASAASISKVDCSSKTESEAGGRISFEGGVQKEHYEIDGLEQGTQIVIKDLFYNTPARLKFIKSQISEKNALKSILNSYLLCHPQIEFHIKWDDKDKQIWKKSNIDTRLKKIIGKKSDIFDSYHFDKDYEGIKVDGILCASSESRSLPRTQFIFVNNRPIEDRSLHFLITNTFQAITKFSFVNSYYVNISTPPEELDVNVHPNKTTIKFMEPGKIYSLVKAAIQESVRSSLQELNPTPPSKQNLLFENSVLNEQKDIKSYEGFKEKHTNKFSDIKSIDHSIEDTQTSELSILSRIFPYYILGNFSGDIAQISVINIKTLIEKYIELNKGFEFTPVPLLISLPFNIGEKAMDSFNFESWNKSGFEFDKLNHEKLILRAIPEYLDGFDTTSVINLLLGNYEHEHNLHLIDLSLIKRMKSFFEYNELVQLKCLIPLNHESLKDFFYE